MAKKKKAAAKKAPVKAAKKAKGAKPPKVWKPERGAERATAAKRTVQTPTQPPLIKGARIRSLDKLCEQISDTRAAMNRLRGEEADLERHLHLEMKKHKKMSWQFAGVEASRTPGEEKLRIRTSRETSTTTNDDDETTEPAQTPERADAVDEEPVSDRDGGEDDDEHDAINALADGDDDNPFGDSVN